MRAIVAGATDLSGGCLLQALMESGVEPVALARTRSHVHRMYQLGAEKRLFDEGAEISWKAPGCANGLVHPGGSGQDH